MVDVASVEKRMMHIFSRAKRGAASGTLLTCAALTRLGVISFSDPGTAVETRGSAGIRQNPCSRLIDFVEFL